MQNLTEKLYLKKKAAAVRLHAELGWFSQSLGGSCLTGTEVIIIAPLNAIIRDIYLVFYL